MEQVIFCLSQVTIKSCSNTKEEPIFEPQNRNSRDVMSPNVACFLASQIACLDFERLQKKKCSKHLSTQFVKLQLATFQREHAKRFSNSQHLLASICVQRPLKSEWPFSVSHRNFSMPHFRKRKSSKSRVATLSIQRLPHPNLPRRQPPQELSSIQRAAAAEKKYGKRILLNTKALV